MSPEKVERFANVAYWAGVDVEVTTESSVITGKVIATDGGIDMLTDWVPFGEVTRIVFDDLDDAAIARLGEHLGI